MKGKIGKFMSFKKLQATEDTLKLTFQATEIILSETRADCKT